MKPIEAFEKIERQVNEHKIFIKHAKPDSWDVDDNLSLWFRGEGRKYENTFSTLVREVRSAYDDNLTASKPYHDIDMYQTWVYTKVRKFLFENNKDIFEEFSDSWDYPFFMQHYGVPTSFIDFTPSLETALYFATKNINKTGEKFNVNDCPVLWLFDPYTHNYFNRNKNTPHKNPHAYNIGGAQSGNFYDFMVFGGKWGENNTYENVVNNASEINGKPNFVEGISIALSPHTETRIASKKNQRMYSQTGYFYYSKNLLRDLTVTIKDSTFGIFPKEYKEILDKIILKKIEIPIEEAKLIRQYLQETGHTDEMYGLCPTSDIAGFNKSDFSYKTYLKETNNGWDGKDEDFVRKFITPLEIWLDK